MFQKRKEMEEVSAALEKLLNGEEVKFSGKYEDTLPSKVYHQIGRLSEKIAGNQKRMLREKEDIKELIADIAHQLRNPLANMESYLELLSQPCSEEEREFYIKAIGESEEKIRFLTESFIKMARLENRIIQIKKESVNLNETLLNSILQAKKAAEKKKIEIRLEMEESLVLPHDPNWLGEAVYNFLDNSIKYSAKNSVVEITVTQNEMYTQICVSDSGMGILPEEETLIFQRFYRGKGVTNQDGFGLGLYIAREIVQLHDGFLKVKRKGKGLDVSVYLPDSGK